MKAHKSCCEDLENRSRNLEQTLAGPGKAGLTFKEAYDIFNRSPIVVFLWKNQAGCPVEFVSENVTQLFGYSTAEFLSEKISYAEIVHPDDLEQMADEVALFSEDKERQIFTHEPYRVITKGGEEKWIADTTYIRRDPDGAITHYEGFVHDISKIKSDEEERNRLLSAIHQAAESVVITDTEGTIRYINPAFERISGYTSEEIIGQNPRILKSGRHDETFYKELWSTIKHGGIWKGEFVNKSKDGTLFAEETTISPVFDSRGNIISYIAVRYDMTRQRMLEAQLNQAQKMEIVGRLAGGVAHDFNNMLSVILGQVDLMKIQLSPHDPILKGLGKIERAANHSADITRQLLAFSRKQVIAPKVMNLNPLIRDTVRMLGRLLGEDIDIMFCLAKDLWNLEIDPTQIDQVVVNLGINARDAMPDGGKLTIGTANVTIDDAYCRKHAGIGPGQFVMMTVRDDGIGMDRETLLHIFEPFFTTKGEGKGTGLGLATSYGIIKQNNGFIYVYSKPGQGTTFKIYFPRCLKEAKNIEKPIEAPKSSVASTILLVEDDEMVRNLTKTMLERNGCTVLVAETPNDAVELCEKNGREIHLLLTDVVMPRMNGKVLKASIEAIKPGIKTLFMSGYTSDVIVHHGVLEEGTNFIQKPFKMDELVRKVHKTIEA